MLQENTLVMKRNTFCTHLKFNSVGLWRWWWWCWWWWGVEGTPGQISFYYAERLHVTYIVFSTWQQRCCSQQGWMSCSAKHSTVNLCSHTRALSMGWVVRVCVYVRVCDHRECIKARMTFNWNVFEIQITFSFSSALSFTALYPPPHPSAPFLSSGSLSQLSSAVKIFSLHVSLPLTHTYAHSLSEGAAKSGHEYS